MIGLRKLALIGSLVLASQAAAAHQVVATATGFSSSSGRAIFALFDSKEGFASDLDKAASMQSLAINGDSVTATFSSLSTQDFALFVFHDADDDGEFKTNWIGFPKEGVGNSNNHKGIPSFAKSAFNPSQTTSLSIEMWYP